MAEPCRLLYVLSPNNLEDHQLPGFQVFPDAAPGDPGPGPRHQEDGGVQGY